MDKKDRISKTIKQSLVLLLCFVIPAAFLLPAGAADRKTAATVRVGWYESPFNLTDSNGRRSGYAYEYQRKISAYTGWNYEYVEGSWPELLEMLKNGEIDLLSDVSYTEERAEQMLFSSHSMGTEEYYLFVSPDKTDITSDDVSSINQKKIGVNKGSVQADYFRDWAQTHGVSAELIELAGSESESQQMVVDGELDGFVTLDMYGSVKNLTPVLKIGSSDFCFAVSKDRSGLLAELDVAMGKIQSENRFYNDDLYEKYFKESAVVQSLTAEERSWLTEHGPIRVAYQNNYMAFCAEDDKGELTGALKDFLDAASTCLPNTEIQFEAISYPTATDAMDAVLSGEADCMFPANFTDYDCENLGLVMTPTLMRTEMEAVVRDSDQKEFLKKENIAVAVNQGNANYDLFLENNFPDWEPVYFKDTPTCLDELAAGQADCILISAYRFNNISQQCEKLHLTTVYTGVDMDYGFAVPAGSNNLYSILAKVIDVVPKSTVNAALTYFSTQDAKTDLLDFIRDNILIILPVFTVIALVIILLLLRINMAQRKVIESRRTVESLNKRVFVDALTSVRNKGAFNEYLEDLQTKLDEDGSQKVAIGVLDCNDLKTINDRYGHDKGDEYLKVSCKLICRVFRHSPVFRTGGDEFVVILQNEDYENKEALVERFRKDEEEIRVTSDNRWEHVSVAIGIAEYDPSIDSSLSETLKRADQNMYHSKRKHKQNKKDDQKK